jgi:hypothetical protein
VHANGHRSLLVVDRARRAHPGIERRFGHLELQFAERGIPDFVCIHWVWTSFDGVPILTKVQDARNSFTLKRKIACRLFKAEEFWQSLLRFRAGCGQSVH